MPHTAAMMVPLAKYYASYLLPLGGIIYLVFFSAGLGRYRVAWYFSLSAPGSLVLPYTVIAIAITDWIGGARTAPWGAAFNISFVFFPGVWIWPVVFVFQVTNLVLRKRIPMTASSYVGCTMLLLLYFWGDYTLYALRHGLLR